MDRWNGKVAVVTGASSGVGLETSKLLVLYGMIVIGLARRKGKMEEEMRKFNASGQFYARECDVTNEHNVRQALEWTYDNFGSLNVLVNNAGKLVTATLEDISMYDADQTIKINMLGYMYAAKHAIRLMKETERESHIINMNSLLGHYILPPTRPKNVYPATKFATTGFTQTLAYELASSKIRVTSISPGLVETEMTNPANYNYTRAFLKPFDVAHAVVYALSAPPSVEIAELKLEAKSYYKDKKHCLF